MCRPEEGQSERTEGNSRETEKARVWGRAWGMLGGRGGVSHGWGWGGGETTEAGG